MKIENRIRAGVMLAVWIVSAAAGGCSAKEKPPAIANLVYFLMAHPVAEGKNANVAGTFNLTEISGEIAAVNGVVYDAQGKQIAANTISLTDASLQPSDTLAFEVEIPLSKKGEYTFQIYVTDSKGRQSNRLTGTFKVTDIF